MTLLSEKRHERILLLLLFLISESGSEEGPFGATLEVQTQGSSNYPNKLSRENLLTSIYCWCCGNSLFRYLFFCCMKLALACPAIE